VNALETECEDDHDVDDAAGPRSHRRRRGEARLHEGRQGRAPGLHEEPDRPRGRRRQPGRADRAVAQTRRSGAQDGRRLGLRVQPTAYGAGGVIEPNSPWVSSSGPAAKYSVSFGPDAAPLPKPMPQRPSIVIGRWSVPLMTPTASQPSGVARNA